MDASLSAATEALNPSSYFAAALSLYIKPKISDKSTLTRSFQKES